MIDRVTVKALDEILDEQANIYMMNWNLEEFKKTYPKLYNVILLSMIKASKNTLTLSKEKNDKTNGQT